MNFKGVGWVVCHDEALPHGLGQVPSLFTTRDLCRLRLKAEFLVSAG